MELAMLPATHVEEQDSGVLKKQSPSLLSLLL